MKFLALALALASLPAFAAQNSSINDLQYVPKAGTLYGDTTLGVLRYSSRDFNGTDEIKTSLTGQILTQRLGYGATEQLFVFGELAYVNTKSKSTGEDETESTGLADVRLNARMRLLDGTERFDLLARVSLSPGDAIEKSNGDSNAYSGGHGLTIGASYGVKTGQSQWAFSGSLTHNLKATTDDKSAGEKIKTDAHNELDLEAAYLGSVSENVFLKSSVAVNFVEEYEDSDDLVSTGTTQYKLGQELQWRMSENLLVRGGYEAILGGSGYNYVFMLYSAGVNYQF